MKNNVRALQESPDILPVYKPLGKTPLEVIKELQQLNKALETIPIGYAGRLDPMAEGILLLLLGETNKKRKTYELLPKTYEFSILCGLSTDSYDLLGKITKTSKKVSITKETIQTILPSFLGKQMQSYPPYSSARISGKPLFYWARENKLDTIAIPQKEITITSLILTKETTISAKKLHEEIVKRMSKVSGDFRQDEIMGIWNTFFISNQQTTFQLFSCTINCSSGTYIRSLSQNIGEKLKVPITTFSIKRTRVGEFTLSDCLHVFSQ